MPIQSFGRYLLLDQIAKGGMAEIYRSRYATPDAGSRIFALKCLLPIISREKRFLEMFRAETKITLGLLHPNIVQHYDFGDGSQTLLDGQPRPYIAMEYLPGKSLRQVFNSLRKSDSAIPMGMAVMIAEQIAKGLHYAHEYRDPLSERNMGIIHRDMSPQNVLIGYDGTVKIIDFGIAKAVDFGETTESGLIKGTPAYLSPEQVRARGDLDRRSDIFTLGILTWELLVNRRLFAIEDQRMLLLAIEKSQDHVIPPSQANPNVTPELDAVVMKALENDRTKRFQTAEEFRHALRAAGESIGLTENTGVVAKSLSEFMGASFAKELQAEAKALRDLNIEAEAWIRKQAPFTENPSSSDFGGATQAIPAAQAEPSPKLPPISLEAPRLQEETVAVPRVANPADFYPSGAIELVQASANEVREYTADYNPESEELEEAGILPPPRRSAGAPVSEAVIIDNDHLVQKINRNRQQRAFEGVVPDVGPNRGKPQKKQSNTLHVLLALFFLGGAGLWYFGNRSSDQPANPDAGTRTAAAGSPSSESPGADVQAIPPPAQSAPEDSTAASLVDQVLPDGYVPVRPGRVAVFLRIQPPGPMTTIKVNDKFVVPNFPLALFEALPEGQAKILIQRNGFAPWSGEISVASIPKDPEGRSVIDVVLAPTVFGLVTIDTTVQAMATFTQGSNSWTRPTPLRAQKFAPGKYTVEIESANFGTHRSLSFDLEEGRAFVYNDDLSRKN